MALLGVACDVLESDEEKVRSLLIQVATPEEISDPASAQFRNLQRNQERPNTWCGEVNLKNALGGYTGFHRFVAWDTGVDVDNPSDPVDVETYDWFWKKMCEEGPGAE